MKKTIRNYRPFNFSGAFREDTNLDGHGVADSEFCIKATLLVIKRNPGICMDDIFYALNTRPENYSSDKYAFKKYILGQRRKGEATLPLAKYVCVNSVSREWAYVLTEAGEEMIASWG